MRTKHGGRFDAYLDEKPEISTYGLFLREKGGKL